ncbi:hypothetical protein SGPA1_30995 [Streptomyces misionensis JCM 4497]
MRGRKETRTERPETARRHTGTGRARPRRARPPGRRGARPHRGAAPLGTRRGRPGRTRTRDRRGGGRGLGRTVLRLRPRDRRRCRTAARRPGPGHRRHPLRPGLADQAVHLGRRRAADRARHPGDGRRGRPLPARVPRRRRTRHHGAAVAHPHLRSAARTAAVRLPGPRRPAGDAARRGADERAGRLPVLRPEHAAAPVRPGARHRTPPRRPGAPLHHPAARHDRHPVRALPGGRRHRGPVAAVGQGRPRDAAGRRPRRERLGARRGGRARRAVLHRGRPRRLLPHPARGRLLRHRAHPRPGLRGPAAVPARTGLRRGPALVHGRAGGPGRGGAHRVHRHLPGRRPGDGHLPGAAGQRGASAQAAGGQPAAGADGDMAGESRGVSPGASRGVSRSRRTGAPGGRHRITG